MALIRHRKPAADRWQLLEAAADGGFPVLPLAAPVIVTLAQWQAQRESLLARSGDLGVWLAAEDDPAALAPDLERLMLVAVRFKSFTDGRGYSIGRLLRERHGYRGELRAIGDIQRDQLLYLERCGFDAFSLREGEEVDVALQAFHDFAETYQAAVDQPLPLYRRRAARAA